MSELDVTTPRMAEPTSALVKQAYAAVVSGELPPEVGDPRITARMIQDRIIKSDSFEEVFSSQKLPPWESIAGEVVTVGGFHLNPSSYDSGSAVYAVVELRRHGEDDFHPYQCGGEKVLIQLIKAWEQGWFPFSATLRVDPTGSGNRVFSIEAA